MNSNTNNTHQGVQPLVADDAGSADIKSDEELNGASEDDGPLHQAEEANNAMTISGDGPEILRKTTGAMLQCGHRNDFFCRFQLQL